MSESEDETQVRQDFCSTCATQATFSHSHPTKLIRAENPSKFLGGANCLANLTFLPSVPFSPSRHPTRASSTTANMSAPSLNKIAANSPSRQNPSDLERAIAGALYDLETNTADLKAALRPLQFVSAREVRSR